MADGTETYATEVVFEGDAITATVTTSGAAVEAWVAGVRALYPDSVGAAVVGLDVEWRPSYRPEQNPVALLQLCVHRSCLIFQLLHADYIPESLAEFLGNSGYCFVGVGVVADAERLDQDYDLGVANPVDLRGHAAVGMNRPELRRAGLKAVARAVMGANLDKPQRVTMSRWDDYSLSDEQVKYACIDAFVSFEVGRRLF